MAMTRGLEKQIRRLFRRELMRISELCRRDGERVIAGNPDRGLESYYTSPPTRKMSKADFESGGSNGLDGFEDALLRLWAEEKRPEYSALATGIAKLARSVRANEEHSSELSQFVYVMY